MTQTHARKFRIPNPSATSQTLQPISATHDAAHLLRAHQRIHSAVLVTLSRGEMPLSDSNSPEVDPKGGSVTLSAAARVRLEVGVVCGVRYIRIPCVPRVCRVKCVDSRCCTPSRPPICKRVLRVGTGRDSTQRGSRASDDGARCLGQLAGVEYAESLPPLRHHPYMLIIQVHSDLSGRSTGSQVVAQVTF